MDQWNEHVLTPIHSKSTVYNATNLLQSFPIEYSTRLS